jgi:eukaryotic-like serine/threonine-protein kinase
MIEDNHPEPAQGAAATRHADSKSASSMTPERWEQAKKLFEAAQELERGERASFLNRACPDDLALRREVESLLSGDRRAVDFLEKPILADAPKTDSVVIRVGALSLGQVLSGRFRVIRFLGQGGMGEVYEAKDLDLGERVALKTIRAEIASQPHAMARFKQEIHLARHVTHPNVCRMFDLGRHRPPPDADPSAGVVTFLTMELLEGETLAARLGRVGRMTTAEALPLVQHMAEALAAAHEVGVVHCDFKPGNVMLVPSKSGDGKERAVVTDFGLAKAVVVAGQAAGESPAPAGIASGHMIGTIAYMAPEQLEGREATPASDIYALGLVIYETITGKRPFPDDVPFAGVVRRLTQPPLSPHAHVPDLDPCWDHAVMRCLDIDPGRRFQNARDVAEACSTKAPAGLDHRPAPGDSPSPAHVRRLGRLPALAVLLVAAVALLWVGARVMGVRPKQAAVALLTRLGVFHPVNERDWILVADFENQTDEKQFDGTVGALVSEALLQSNYVNVVPRLRVLDGARRAGDATPTVIDAELGRDICVRDGYRALLTGRVSQRGSAYFIMVQVVDPHNEMAVVTMESEAMRKVGDLYPAVDKLAARLRRRLGESLAQIEKRRPLPSVTTPNLEALARYQRALELFAALDFQGSVAMAKSAIELDPHFAMAHLLLAANYDRRADEKSVQAELESAKQEIDHVPDRERHLILALNYSEEYQFESAAVQYRILKESSPGDIEAVRGLAESEFWAGQTADGLEQQRQTLQMTGSGDADYNELIIMLIYVNRPEDALEVYKQARDHGLENLQMHWGAAVAQWCKGDLAAARKELETLSNSGDSYYQDLSKLYSAGLLIYEGDLKRAVQQLTSQPISEAQNPAIAVSYLDLLIRAEVVLNRHPPPAAYAPTLLSLSQYTAHPLILLEAGLLAIELGDQDLSRQVLARMRAAANSEGSAYVQCATNTLKGALALAEGQTDTAIKTEGRATLYPLVASPHFILAKAHEARGDWQEAADEYERYLAYKGVILRGDFPGNWVLCHLYLARADAKAGLVDKSRYYYDEFLRLWDRPGTDVAEVRQARAERRVLAPR